MKEESKNNQVLLTIIVVSTLLVAVVGLSFAYFTATVTGNDTASSVIVNTADIGSITYTNNTQLSLPNAYPGATASINFTVSSSGEATTSTQYVIGWVNVTNTFADKADLVYTITPNTTGGAVTAGAITISETIAPSSTTTDQFVQAGSIATIQGGKTHSYNLTVHFKEAETEQNDNQGKSFNGKIEVRTAASGDVYYTQSAKSGTTTEPAAY